MSGIRSEGWHYMARTKGGECPERYLTLGVELSAPILSDKCAGGMTLFCNDWHVMDWRKADHTPSVYTQDRGAGYYDLWTAVSKLLEKRKCLDLWCSGAANILAATDFWAMLDLGEWMLSHGDWKGNAVLSDPPFILTVRPAYRAGVLRIIDIGNLGVTVNPHPQDSRDQARWLGEYLRDWYAMIEREELGSAKRTLAAQAWEAYRHCFLRDPIAIHTDKQALRLESDALFQGRTECLRIGRVEGPIYELDIQSCYPAVARGLMPARLKMSGGQMPTVYMKSLIAQGWGCVAEVTIQTHYNDYPAHHNGLQVFPVGTFDTVLCGPELKHALTTGAATKVNRYAAYEMSDLFTPWVNWCIDKRREAKEDGNRNLENASKLLANSLFGRFARRKRLWKNVSDVLMPSRWSELWESDGLGRGQDHYRCIAGLVQEEQDLGFAPDTSPIITAWISSLARWELRRYALVAGVGNVCYLATDALHVTYDGLLNLQRDGNVSSGDIGYLVEKHEWQYVDYNGIHDYATDVGRKLAGSPFSATSNDDGTTSWESVESPMAAIRRGEIPSARLVPRSRGAVGAYRHGVVLVDGRVSPMVLGVK